VVGGGGIILIKYWFEVSEKEQTTRFLSRIGDGRKIWKLSPMDLVSHRRWYDYSRARRYAGKNRHFVRTLVHRECRR
jgi:polyphosphate kinase 2 (PPK2 family)